MKIRDCADDYEVSVNLSDIYSALLKHERDHDSEAVKIIEEALSNHSSYTGFATGPVLTISQLKRVFPDYWYNPPFCSRP